MSLSFKTLLNHENILLNSTLNKIEVINTLKIIYLP
jgi:hypothetical protein